MMKLSCWIEAMRLRTLPVSVAGVVVAAAYGVINRTFNAAPVFVCLAFAVLAQIASNFANEYYDYEGGLDKPGRVGPRSGVTEGDITPRAMRNATFFTLLLACAVGCTLIYWGGLWLIAAGVLIALGVFAYSSGPYPLSHHGMGELAVIFFFGIIPINLTYYLQALTFNSEVLIASIGVGLLGANVLIVNNYRDLEADQEVGKHTLAVLLGRRRMASFYTINGWLAVALMLPAWTEFGSTAMLVPIGYLLLHSLLAHKISHSRGASLNPMLGMTAVLMLVYCLAFLVAALV